MVAYPDSSLLNECYLEIDLRNELKIVKQLSNYRWIYREILSFAISKVPGAIHAFAPPIYSVTKGKISTYYIDFEVEVLHYFKHDKKEGSQPDFTSKKRSTLV